MCKFKIGDKVKFVNYEGVILDKQRLLGEEFIIHALMEEEDTSWYIGKTTEFRYNDEELELIEEENRGEVEEYVDERHLYTNADIEEVEENEIVNNPSHYCFSNIEPINVIQEWGLNFCLGNALKYISRAGKKGDKIEDLRKAIKYLEFEIESIDKEVE